MNHSLIRVPLIIHISSQLHQFVLSITKLDFCILDLTHQLDVLVTFLIRSPLQVLILVAILALKRFQVLKFIDEV